MKNLKLLNTCAVCCISPDGTPSHPPTLPPSLSLSVDHKRAQCACRMQIYFFILSLRSQSYLGKQRKRQRG